MNRIFHYVKKQQRDESSWSLNETRNALSLSSFNNIPNEIILYIFRFLSMRNLDNVSLVCRSFKIISNQEQLRRFKCDRK
jgi:hypothetical protein